MTDKPTVITIIAYKASDVWHGDYTSSELETYFTTDVELAGAWLGRLQYGDKRGCYEFTVLIDGVPDDEWSQDWEIPEGWVEGDENLGEKRRALGVSIAHVAAGIVAERREGERAEKVREEAARKAGLASAVARRVRAESEAFEAAVRTAARAIATVRGLNPDGVSESGQSNTWERFEDDARAALAAATHGAGATAPGSNTTRRTTTYDRPTEQLRPRRAA